MSTLFCHFFFQRFVRWYSFFFFNGSHRQLAFASLCSFRHYPLPTYALSLTPLPLSLSLFLSPPYYPPRASMGRVKTTTMSGSKHTARRSNSHLPSTPTAGAVHLPGRVSASVSASASAASTPFDSPVSGPSSLTKKSHAARRKLKKSAMENLSAAANVHSATEAGAADALPSSRPSPPPQAADDEDGEAVVVAGEQPGPGSQPEVDHAADHASWKLKLEQSKARRDKMQSAAQNVEKPLKEVVEALRPLPQYAEFINETLEPRLDDLNSLKNSTHNLVIVGRKCWLLSSGSVLLHTFHM